MVKLSYGFFHRPCPEVARDLVGKLLVRQTPDGPLTLRITETECYCGETDTACHASRGRTARTEVMYADAGTIYIYLCYGIHWMLNIVTGDAGDPQAVLIRACAEAPGPGRLTKRLGITGELNRAPSWETSCGSGTTASAAILQPTYVWASAMPLRRIRTDSGDSKQENEL